MNSSPLILVVEDDAAIRQGVVDALDFDGYETMEAATGKAAFSALDTPQISLVLLDLTLPGADGLDILDEVHRRYPNLPVIIITARGAEHERIKGLKKGADDYIPKPFSVRELLARVEAVLRRCKIPTEHVLEDQSIVLGQSTFDALASVIVLKDGDKIKLSEKENDLLRYLTLHPQRCLSRDELLERVWRVSAQKLETRTVDMNISRLRDKLKSCFSGREVLKTVRGQGYVFDVDHK